MRSKGNIQKRKKNTSNSFTQLDFFSWKKIYNKKKKIKKKLQKIFKNFSRTSKKTIYALFVLFLWLGGYILFYSSFFSIQNIYIYRNDTISNIERAYRTVNYIRGQNIFALDTKNTVDRLQKSQPSLKYITIQKKIPNNLNILLESYKPLFYTDRKIILENGYIFETNSDIDDSLHYININRLDDSPEKVNHIHLELISQAIDKLKKASILFWNIQEIQYFETEKEFFLIWENKTILIFDLEKNIENQVEKLIVLHNEKLIFPGNDIIYIDLRISGKIFTCLEEEAEKCNKNLKRIYNYTGNAEV